MPGEKFPEKSISTDVRSAEGSILARYERVDIPGLGSGWDAYVHRRTRECYVCKSIERNQIAENQIKIMMLLSEENNENIGIKGVYGVGDCVKIIMEPCVGQRLSERIEMEEQHHYREAAELTKIILKVIKTCHSSGVTLGNLKRTFIFADRHDDSSLKAMYFGSAEQPAREVRRRRRRDIKLAGEILLLLVTGKRVLEDPRRSSGWTNLPEEAKDLISKMLTDKSVTAEQVLRDIRRSIDQAGADCTRLKTAVRKLNRIQIGERRTTDNRQNRA